MSISKAGTWATLYKADKPLGVWFLGEVDSLHFLPSIETSENKRPTSSTSDGNTVHLILL